MMNECDMHVFKIDVMEYIPDMREITRFDLLVRSHPSSPKPQKQKRTKVKRQQNRKRK